MKKLDMRTFFNGEVEGWGAFFNYRGRQTRSFSFELKGEWANNTGVLKEWFRFDDGQQMQREWQMTFSDDHNFTGRAKDVVGVARGKQAETTIHTEYTLQIPRGKSAVAVKMDDWIYSIDENILLNRATLKKFGFKVGELVIFLRKKN